MVPFLVIGLMLAFLRVVPFTLMVSVYFPICYGHSPHLIPGRGSIPLVTPFLLGVPFLLLGLLFPFLHVVLFPLIVFASIPICYEPSPYHTPACGSVPLVTPFPLGAPFLLLGLLFPFLHVVPFPLIVFVYVPICYEHSPHHILCSVLFVSSWSCAQSYQYWVHLITTLHLPPTYSSIMPNMPAQLSVDYLCSRARAATLEARSEARRNGPLVYYAIWLGRMKMEMVSKAEYPSIHSMS
jgi:hypothetical protein